MSIHKFRRQGILFVVSAPSGTGKTTLVDNLRATPDFIQSVSCTTRKPRPGEQHGRDYFFHTVQEFESMLAAGEFIEHASVYGNYYGTLKRTVRGALAEGTDVLLAIDVQGAAQIRGTTDALILSSLVDVFILPPNYEEWERRLRKRATETEEQIALRLKVGLEEMKGWQSYKYTILSGSMEEDLIKFRAIMRAERYLSSRLKLNLLPTGLPADSDAHSTASRADTDGPPELFGA
ncbi:MAG: guanylate kinase [Candidatus Methylacidiphilales bacterium]|nr:guanylate kinase [Candidatus Methylacidiphilales bacterium]